MFLKNHVRLMPHLKPFVFLILIGPLLTGCTDLFESMGYVPAPSPRTQACDVAPLLITDLTQKPQDRLYQLQNGQPCYQTHLEINPHEKTSMFEPQVESQNIPNFH